MMNSSLRYSPLPIVKAVYRERISFPAFLTSEISLCAIAAINHNVWEAPQGQVIFFT